MHGALLLVELPALVLYVQVLGWIESDAVWYGYHAVLAGLGYRLLVALVNQWTIRADERGVSARYGPLPWLWLRRRFSWPDVLGFLPRGVHAAPPDEGVGGVPPLVGAGIDVLHPDGTTSSLVVGCGSLVQVARVKAELERARR
jgi:hypothetical protein